MDCHTSIGLIESQMDAKCKFHDSLALKTFLGTAGCSSDFDRATSHLRKAWPTQHSLRARDVNHVPLDVGGWV